MNGDMWTDPPRPQDAPSDDERAAFAGGEFIGLGGDDPSDDLPFADEDDDLLDDEDDEDFPLDDQESDGPTVDDPAYDDFAGEPDHVRGDA